METKELLRAWEQTGWPADDFTVEGNREDMVKLARRHDSGESFTYTVMNPAQTQCLGCVYIFPTNAKYYAKSQITPVAGEAWSDFDTAVSFWIRQSRLAAELDRTLVEELDRWLAQVWSLPKRLFMTNEQFLQQVTMLQAAGLHLKFRLDFPSEPGATLAFSFDSTPS